MSETRTIGDLAREAGVGVETIRYYERQGLLAAPARTAAGYRQFGSDAVTRLRFIRRAKELGFTLRQIRELLALRVDPGSTCGQVKAQAEAKRTDIEAKIQSLQRMAEALDALIRACAGRGDPNDADVATCPILKALEHDHVQG